jgi:hypothetical protein
MGVMLRRRDPIRELTKRCKRGWRRWRADVHLVSYPKCGRTWLVLLIAEALQRHHGVRMRNPLKLRRMTSRRRGIPYIHPHHDGGPEFLLPEELETDKSGYRGRKVIFLVRDPRDVLVSSYFQKVKRNYNFAGSMDDYLAERRGGLESIIAFYNIWARNRDVPDDFLMVTYEDLHEDASRELRRVLDFMGITGVGDADIAAAVDACSFENMRRLERDNSFNTGALSPRDPNDEATYKTRQGKAGGFREHLGAEQIAWIDRLIDERLDPLYAQYRSAPDAG